jgi:fumarylacetoacetase
MPHPNCDPALRSWISVDQDCDFPIQNLPYGVFRRPGGTPAVGVAIGDEVLDLAALHDAGLFTGSAVAERNVFAAASLNGFMHCGRRAWTEVRSRISQLLERSCPVLRDDAGLRRQALHARPQVELLLPVEIGDYTDFYSSKDHATNVGSMLRPDNPLLPNWLHIPIGYHGRASSIVVSGVDVRRPCGQTKADDAAAPRFGPTRLLDFELEVGFLTGVDTALGTPVPTSRAAEHIFGMVLVNDWSARDIQKWEYVPLGPFLAKSFATCVSPWVVTLDALDAFRVPGPRQDPPVLPYLRCEGDWAFDMQLEAWIQPAGGEDEIRLTATNFRTMYWNILQQLAHQTSNGVNLRAGDLYASGTVSGAAEGTRGCMLEISWGGKRPVVLPSGRQRAFIEDGDTVILRGWCQGSGYRVGFGEVRNKVLPALQA